MKDLLYYNKIRNESEVLSSKGIEFIELIENSMNNTISTRQVSGRYGTNKLGSVVGDVDLSLKLRFSGTDTMDYIEKEKQFKYLFSIDDEFRITPMYTNKPQYDFVKIGQSQKLKEDGKKVYHYDVVLNGDFQMNRNGLLCDVTIPLKTANVPFRYLETTTIHLNKPTITKGKYVYDTNINGNIPMDSRQFPIELNLSGINAQGLIIDTGEILKLDYTIKSSDKIKFNGYSIYVNGINMTSKSNYGMITLQKGTTITMSSISGVISGNPNGNITYNDYIR